MSTDDLEPDMTDVEVIEKAIGIIDERGWCQHMEEDDDGRVCLNRALDLAMPIRPLSSARVRMRVRRAVSLDPSVLGSLLSVWNDEPGRTVEDVVLALKHAAAGERL
jgi:hypothetical protein